MNKKESYKNIDKLSKIKKTKLKLKEKLKKPINEFLKIKKTELELKEKLKKSIGKKQLEKILSV